MSERKPGAVHQLLPSLAQADAVGNQARYLRKLLREWGFRSELFAGMTDESNRSEVSPPDALLRATSADDVVLVHHSTRSGFLPLLRRVPARKLVLYHNITPGALFAPYEPGVAALCDEGRLELRELAEIADAGYGFTGYSARELDESGFRKVGVLPFPIDWKSFDVAPDARLLDRLSDGRVNVLCVGRIAPNKRVDEAIRAFVALQRLFVPRSRLVLAGPIDPERPYSKAVRAVLQRLMPEEVLLLGKVRREELSACFEAAHVYLSMSVHEGFGVPLVEAMHRRVPVVANARAATPETMGGAGVCVKEGTPVDYARILAVITQDAHVRAGIMASQERRLEQLSRQQQSPVLRRIYVDAIEGVVNEARTAAHR